MTEATAKKHLRNMLQRLTAGSVLHLLGESLREAETLRRGELDEVAKERLANAEGFLIVAGLGLDSVLPR